MASAAFELQKSVYARLIADAALLTLLGGARVYDDQPERAEFPFVSFATPSVRDWSTGTEYGEEHTVQLNVWSRAAGRKEAQDILEACRAALHDVNLALTGFRLINLRYEASDARRESDGETYRGTIRFRAVTEPAS